MINIMKRNLIYLETYYISSKQRKVKKKLGKYIVKIILYYQAI